MTSINEQQAAILTAALDKAIAVVDDLLKRTGKSLQMYKPALQAERATYVAERARIAEGQ